MCGNHSAASAAEHILHCSHIAFCNHSAACSKAGVNSIFHLPCSCNVYSVAVSMSLLMHLPSRALPHLHLQGSAGVRGSVHDADKDYTPLTAEQKNAIEQWVTKSAQDVQV